LYPELLHVKTKTVGNVVIGPSMSEEEARTLRGGQTPASPDWSLAPMPSTGDCLPSSNPCSVRPAARPWKPCSLARVPPASGRFAASAGVVLLLVAALGVVVQLKDAMNTIWNVQEPQEASVWWYLRTYLVSFAGILGLGFLLAVSLVISTVLAALSTWAGPSTTVLGEATNFLVSLTILSALFAMLFKWFPDTEISWGDIVPGAIVTALLFNFGKLLIGWYIGTQGLESTYGAASSIVILLIWTYYSAQIVLFGAELTHAYATQKGSRRTQRPAVPVAHNANV
jgi:YihY family inner membrane protein